MTGFANGVQKALFELLATDAELTAIIGSDGIFDRRRGGLSMPYLIFGHSETDEIAPGLFEYLITLEAWSSADGRRQVQDIAACVERIIANQAPLSSQVHFVSCAVPSIAIGRAESGKAFRAEIRMRLVVE